MTPTPDVEAAFAALGLNSDADEETVRLAFRSLIVSAHPDIAGSDGTEDTIELLVAYRAALSHATSGRPSSGQPAAGHPLSAQPTSNDGSPLHGAPPQPHVWLAATDTIALGCTREEAFVRLVDVAHVLGAITYLDREGDLLEVLLSTRLGDTLSLVVSLQGRADHMEAFLTCEVLDVARHELPGIDQLTELYAYHLGARW